MTDMRVLLPFVIASFAVVAPAQTTWTVTSPTGIDAAIQSASPGDVIVLSPPRSQTTWKVFEPFTVSKGLTIRGQGNRVGYEPQFSKFNVSVDVPVGQVAHFEDLDFTYAYSPFGSGGTTVSVAGGVLRVEDCALRRANGSALRVTDADVTVVRSTVVALNDLYGAGAALEGTNASLALRGCTVTGGDAGCHPVGCFVSENPPVPGICVTGSRLQIEGGTITGGSQIAPFVGVGAPAIEATNSTVSLAGVSLVAGATSGVPVAAIVSISSTPVEMSNVSVVAGTPQFVGPVTSNAPLVRLDIAPSWQRGTTSTVSVTGSPNALFSLWYAPAMTPAATPLVVEPVWILGGIPLVNGVLDGAGLASAQLRVPAATPTSLASIWLQAFSGTALPLRASVIAGGVVR